jgi:hypothetical protein
MRNVESRWRRTEASDRWRKVPATHACVEHCSPPPHIYCTSSVQIMTEVQNPAESLPQSSIDTQSPEQNALVSQLDELLEQYLNTLDEYQKVRAELSKQLSSVSLLRPLVYA